ncbi:MAG: zinc-dependent dehydrogenase [Bacillota bacterium]
MKAVVLEGKEKLVLRDLPMPECGDEEVIIRLEACGICRTDMKCFYTGQRDLKLPRILGHEISGTVFAIGKKAAGVTLGSRVQVSPGLSCGSCRFCRQGRDNMCDYLEIMGFNYDGGFAQYLRIPARGVKNGVLHEIPGGLSFVEASMTEPLACCVNMQESLGITCGEAVLVVGGGRLGILTAKLARLRGAGKVILLEQNAKRRALAAQHEIDYCLNPADSGVWEEILKITGGRGVDVAIPCCPGPAAVNISLQLLAKRGRFGFFSGLMHEEALTVDLNLIHYKEITAIGGYGCSLEHNRKALRLLGSGVVKVKEMITREIMLQEVEEGIYMVKDLAELSVVVLFS